MTTSEYHRERLQAQLVAEFITGEAEIEIDATAAKLIAEAAKLGVKGIDEALGGLSALRRRKTAA